MYLNVGEKHQKMPHTHILYVTSVTSINPSSKIGKAKGGGPPPHMVGHFSIFPFTFLFHFSLFFSFFSLPFKNKRKPSIATSSFQ